MGTEDIEVKLQWDVITTIHELDSLRRSTMRFIEHTAQTMGQKSFDPHTGDEHVIHPMGEMIGAIDSCRRGCFQRYGEDMFKQGSLFNEGFLEDE